MRVTGFLSHLSLDVRYAIRMLRRNPGFTAVAVMSLALGLGVNTAIFSVVHAVLLRPLPYPDSDQLVRIGQIPKGDATIAEYEFLKAHTKAFSSVAGLRSAGERHLVWGSGQDWLSTWVVTTDFLGTLKVPLALGREFNEEETRPTGAHAIVLSHGLWQRGFDGDSRVLGTAITLDGVSHIVVGILPPDFWFPHAVDVLLPLRPGARHSDRGVNTQLVARLADDVSVAQAQSDTMALSQAFMQAHPSDLAPDYAGLSVTPYRDALVANVRANLWLLFGATAALLLIACANLTALLLTRLVSRSKELAVRLALGGSQRALMTQFLAENILLAGLGAAAGLLAGYVLLEVLVAWMPFNLPASSAVGLNGAVILFVLGLAAAIALAFTAAPLLAVRRFDVQTGLQSTGRAAAHHIRTRTRNVLVVAEVAVATTLLIAAGLLLQSLYRLHQEPLGFASSGLLTFETPLAPDRREVTPRHAFTQALISGLQQIPGVRGAAAITVLPLTGQKTNLPTQHDGHIEHSIGGMEIRAITPGYFEVMGIPVQRGRSFTEADTASSPPVVAVNETVRRQWWSQTEPIGDRVLIGRFKGREFLKVPPREVVGVVGDTKTLVLAEPPRPTIFIPITQGFPSAGLAWIVRADAPGNTAAQIRQVVASIDPAQRVGQLRTMDDLVSSTRAHSRFNASLFGVFATVAVLLAAVGVYGVLSFLVAQRFQEIGIRIALGARRTTVLASFLRQGLGLTTTGLVLGLAAAFFLSRSLSTLLYGVQANDPLNFAGVALLLFTIGLAASLVPAYRATTVDPVVTLRSQ